MDTASFRCITTLASFSRVSFRLCNLIIHSFTPDSSDDDGAEGEVGAQDNEEGGLARRTRARLTLGDTFDFNKADEELGMVVQQLEDDNKTQARHD